MAKRSTTLLETAAIMKLFDEHAVDSPASEPILHMDPEHEGFFRYAAGWDDTKVAEKCNRDPDVPLKANHVARIRKELYGDLYTGRATATPWKLYCEQWQARYEELAKACRKKDTILISNTLKKHTAEAVALFDHQQTKE